MKINLKVKVSILASALLLTGCGSDSGTDPKALVASGCALFSQNESKFTDPEKAIADFTAAAEADSQYQALADAANFYITTAKNQTSESGIEVDAVNTILGACA